MKTIEQLRKELGGKFFSVTFTKKNGEIRKLNGRLGVTKGVTGKGMNYDPTSFNYLTVYDVKKHAFRMVNLSTVQTLQFRGSNIWQ